MYNKTQPQNTKKNTKKIKGVKVIDFNKTSRDSTELNYTSLPGVIIHDMLL